MAIAIQASLICRPSTTLQLKHVSLSSKPRIVNAPNRLSFDRREGFISDLGCLKSRFLSHRSVISCTLNPESNGPVSSGESEADIKKSLQPLTAEADANPKDNAAKQNEPPAEQNKRSFWDRIFKVSGPIPYALDYEIRQAQYVQKLVLTTINRILPDQKSGKPLRRIASSMLFVFVLSFLIPLLLASLGSLFYYYAPLLLPVLLYVVPVYLYFLSLCNAMFLASFFE